MAEKPWPLMVISVIADVEARYAREEVDLLKAHMDMLYVMARNKLQEEGRMRDIRRLTLVVHNEDEPIVRIDRNQSTTGEG